MINHILGTDLKLDQSTKLNLNLEDESNRKALKSIKYMKLPHLKTLGILMSENDVEDMNDFITHSFPDQLQNFNFVAQL